jgi:aspartate 1-decarboxylase
LRADAQTDAEIEDPPGNGDGCNPDYVGSITLDPELMAHADLLVNEQVHVWDISNGSRFVTYAIAGEQGSGAVRVNGAAALLVNGGDKLIIASFAGYDERDLENYAPAVVHVDADNAIARVDSDPGLLLDSPLASGAQSVNGPTITLR